MMTALASASSQHSDGSEFAMSDSSMLEFVRDLNGQSDNRYTVELPFDIETPVPKVVEERSSSPEIDLVPSYLLTTSSQLIPNSSNSLFNYRPAGHFRKKLSSLGTTLFSRTPPSGIPAELLSEPEKSAVPSPTQSADQAPAPTKRGFVFPGRADASTRKQKESLDETAVKQDHSWLKSDSSNENAVGNSDFVPLAISDPFLASDLNDLSLQTRKEAPENPFAGGPTISAPVGQTTDNVSNTTLQKKAELIEASRTDAKAKAKSKKIAKLESGDGRRSLEASAVKDATIPSGATTSEKKEKVGKSVPAVKTQKDESGRKSEKPTSTAAADAHFEKMREAVKNANPHQSTTKNVEEKRGEENAGENPKAEDANTHTKKSRKKSPKSHTLVPIDNTPVPQAAPISVPKSRPPAAVSHAPHTNLPKDVKREDTQGAGAHEREEGDATDPPHPKSVGIQKQRVPEPDPRSQPIRPSAPPDGSTQDRTSELQFSPFVVSRQAESSQPANTATYKSRKSTHTKVDLPRASTSSPRVKTASSTLLPSWAKLPETLRSSTRGSRLSPMQRLTTLFSGPDSHSQSNTVSESAVFSPRQPDKTWQEKPTVQSLGDIFARPSKTATFEQVPTARFADTFARPGNTESHRWRTKFKFGFSSAKESKVTKPKAPLERSNLSGRERKPKGILKSTVAQGTFPVGGRSEGGSAPPARLPQKESGAGGRKKGGLKK